MVKVNKSDYEFDKKRFLKFCECNKLRFPQSFIAYLMEHNDAELEANIIYMEDNECNIRYFYGTTDTSYSDICNVYEEYIDRLPAKCVPIADPDFGNQICMSLAEETYGKIYFWDHETMDTDYGETCAISMDDMILLADSFEELLENTKESPYMFEIEKKPGILQRLFNRINLK